MAKHQYYHTLVYLWMLAFWASFSTSVSAQTTVVDLSQNWTLGALYNKNKAYTRIQNALSLWTLGYVVVQNGELVAEGYTCRGSEGQDGQWRSYSVTKNWNSLFIGLLVDEGKLSLTETLGDIFNVDSDWEGVDGSTEKKLVTVEELLTMTSWLVEVEDPPEQTTLQGVLNRVQFNGGQKGTFNYLPTFHILSRVIERRAGMTPREYANSKGVFSKLGITDSDFTWTTFGGVEGSAYGLSTNPRVLAKLGQLYLQNGLSAPGESLVSSSWVDASVQPRVGYSLPFRDEIDGYGYQWYILKDSDGGAVAIGRDGQFIVFVPNAGVTISIMSEGFFGVTSALSLLETILNNLGGLSVEETGCFGAQYDTVLDFY